MYPQRPTVSADQMGLLQDLASGKTIKLVNGRVPQVITQTVVPILRGDGNIISLPSVAEASPLRGGMTSKQILNKW